MDGFYVGDIIGNSYTHENEKYNLKTKNFKLFTDRSKFSDDTILSFATIYWLLYTNHKPNEMIDVLKQFFKSIEFGDFLFTYSWYSDWVDIGLFIYPPIFYYQQ